tara:strand:- start:2420 stop:4354 length:1935 start_codon:yes stop_codon:yes gene_type:complete
MINQILQKGIKAHKKGDLKKANKLYRSIIKYKPNHPHANHNLGILSISLNKVEEGLILFRNALKADPKIEQFWLSYIDALIKDHQYDNAKQVTDQAKQYWGVSPEKLKDFELQLFNICEREDKNSGHPTETQMYSLLEYFQSGDYFEAEKLAILLAEKFKSNNFSWKILGAIYKKTDRYSNAIYAGKKTIEINPDDHEAYFNFGNTLKDLERLNEAEDIYKKAITLKPNYAEAHCNLGSTLIDLGEFKKAKESCKQAILLEPNFEEALVNLGLSLKNLGELKKAEISCRKAISIRETSLGAHTNLGLILLEQGRVDEAKASCSKAISIKPDDSESIFNLSIVLDYMNELDDVVDTLQNILQLDYDNHSLRARVFLAIFNFLEGNFEESKKNLLASLKIKDKLLLKFKNEKIYHTYLLNILSWHEDNFSKKSNLDVNKDLFVIGDSHSLTNHMLKFKSSHGNFVCQSKLIMGCKQWHLGNSSINKFKIKFRSIFKNLPKSSQVLLIFGEIDCRIDTGIILHKNKYPKKDLKKIAVSTIENYLTFVFKENINSKHNIIIQGVPCPNIDVEAYTQKEILELIKLIKVFNIELKKKSMEKGFRFLDVYKITNRGDGLSNNIWHADNYHLSPKGVLEAWNRHDFEMKNE